MSDTDSIGSSIIDHIAGIAMELDQIFPGVAMDIEYRATHEDGGAVSYSVSLPARQTPRASFSPEKDGL